MISAIAHRGPDGVGYHTRGPVALGFALLATAPDDLRRSQPLQDDLSGLVLVFDGRVDNRDEIRAALGRTSRTDTDAELVLHAFQRWGEDSPGRLVGDFSYVVWNPNKRTLFCARDQLGVRPLVYYTDGTVFLCASELHQLFQHPSVPRRPNLGMIAEELSTKFASREDTLYRDISRLAPGHWLVVSPLGVRKKRYWALDLSRQVRCRTDRDYADEFFSTFREAVRCRLYSHGPVAAELSGGIDSSCVVGMCQHLFREGTASADGFETISLVFPGLPADETRWFRQVVDFWNLKSNEVLPQPDPAWFANCAKLYLDLPDSPNGSPDLCSIVAHQKGFRVVLTGTGGDEWWGHPVVPPGRFRRAVHRLRAQPNVRGVRSVWRDFIGMARRARRSDARAMPWIPDAFVSSSGLSRRLARLGRNRVFADSLRTLCLEMRDRSSARCGVETRHPFHDRRLVEFAAALPPEQSQRCGLNKFLVRQAMKGLVPEPILQRSTKAEFSHTVAQVYECEDIAAVFRSMHIAALGWIDQGCLAAMFDEFLHQWHHGQKDCLPDAWPLVMAFGIELWFRAAFPNGCRG